MIALIILAAGQSQRFGSPKALAVIDGQPIIERMQNNFLPTSVGEIIVVLGAHAQSIEPHIFKHKKISSVYNKDHKFGQSSSVQTALRILSNDVKGFFILPVDYPLIVPQTLEALTQKFEQKKKAIIIPTFNQHRGHPPLFDIYFKEQILNLPTDQGLNAIIHQNASVIVDWEVCDAGVLKTFNTPEELKSII